MQNTTPRYIVVHNHNSCEVLSHITQRVPSFHQVQIRSRELWKATNHNKSNTKQHRDLYLSELLIVFDQSGWRFKGFNLVSINTDSLGGSPLFCPNSRCRKLIAQINHNQNRSMAHWMSVRSRMNDVSIMLVYMSRCPHRIECFVGESSITHIEYIKEYCKVSTKSKSSNFKF